MDQSVPLLDPTRSPKAASPISEALKKIGTACCAKEEPRTCASTGDKKTKVEVSSIGGDRLEVDIAENATVGELEQALSQVGQLGLCFTIACGDDGTHLSDPAAKLPLHRPLQYFREDTSCLCAAAQKILKESRPSGAGNGSQHLGACRKLGQFPSGQWKSYPRVSSGITRNDNWRFADYNVFEMTIVDGAGKIARLIGIISFGDGDIGVGMFGSIYLRPGFQEVAAFEDRGDCDTRLLVLDVTWYTEHEEWHPLFECSEDDLMEIYQITPSGKKLGLHLIKAFAEATDD